MHGQINTDPQRMMSLFAGNSKASGTHDTPTLDANGVKWSIKKTAKTLKEGASLEWWTQHLEGKRPLGIVPVCDDCTCTWGSIDVDDYDVDHIDIIKKVIAHKLPLLPCRSKSGGLHLFLFTSEPVPAAVMQAALANMAALLGYAGCEIFPKQTKMGNGASGNWMAMPYLGTDFKGRIRFQFGLKKTGAEMLLNEFLDAAENMRITHDELKAFVVIKTKKQKQAQPTSDDAGHKYAEAKLKRYADELRNAASHGNNLLNAHAFHMGTMVAREWIERDDVEEAFKAAMVHWDNLDHHLETLKRAISDGEKEPHDDLGDGGDIPAIVGFKKIDSENPIWFITVEGSNGEMKIQDIRDITDYRRFNNQCGKQLNRVFPVVKQVTWANMLIAVFATMEVVQAEEDTTPIGQFKGLLHEFLTNYRRSTRREDLLAGMPWEDEDNGRHVFTMGPLTDFLAKRMHNAGLNDIREWIKGLEGKSVHLTVNTIRLNCWSVSSSTFVKHPPLALPTFAPEPL